MAQFIELESGVIVRIDAIIAIKYFEETPTKSSGKKVTYPVVCLVDKTYQRISDREFQKLYELLKPTKL